MSKAKADVVLISGHDGGTGASPWSSIKHVYRRGSWDWPNADLVLNDCAGDHAENPDYELKTGRDVAIAALLGADEFGFRTARRVASGCIMMRLSSQHLAHRDYDPGPGAARQFEGKPEHVVNFDGGVHRAGVARMAELPAPLTK